MKSKRRLVADAVELSAGELLEHGDVLAEHALEQRLGEDEHVLCVGAGADVGQLRVDRDGGVRDERPGRGRPDQQLVALPGLAVVLGDREADVHRGVVDVSVDVGLAELVA